jgi:cobalamin biosynthesis protein CobD/CbiB
MDQIAASSSRNSIALFFGALATILAAAIGAVLAIVFAATVVVIGAMASILLGLTHFALRTRRTARADVRTPSDPQLIEARRVGGHSWVAYGWDRRNS